MSFFKSFQNLSFGRKKKAEKKEDSVIGLPKPSLEQPDLSCMNSSPSIKIVEHCHSPEPVQNYLNSQMNGKDGYNIESFKVSKEKAHSYPTSFLSTASGSTHEGLEDPLHTPKTGLYEEVLRSNAFNPLYLTAVNTNPNGFFIHHFEIHRTLGTGSFGRVHLVKFIGNNEYFAMKVLKKSKIVELKQINHTINERNILARISHPFIVKMLCTFQDAQHLYMVLEYVVGGELFSILRRAQRFPNDIAKFYAAEVILALEYLHKLNLIYRDLKPENILINGDGHIKLTDFGFAKYVPDITKTLCGTPEYLAPEIIASKQYNKSVDWYSLGILVYEMLAGFPPFYNDNHLVLYEAVLQGNMRFPPHFDIYAVDLIKNLCSIDVSKRYGNLKGGIDDIKNHLWFAGVDWQKLYEKKIRPPYIPKIASGGDTRHFEFYPEEQSYYGICDMPDPYYEYFRDF